MNQRLYEKRIKKGWTKADVARFLKISDQHYSYIENGERTPSYQLMIKIGDLFGVKPDYIFLDFYSTKSRV